MPHTRSEPAGGGLDTDALRDAVELHLARHIGPAQAAFVDADGWEGRSKEPGPPVDVLISPPLGERRFAYVATCGSALKTLPAAASPGAQAGAHRVEFVLAAPQHGEEDEDKAMLNLAANTVRQFAKLVHLQPIAVAPGHTVAFSHDPAPVFPGSKQVAFAFMAPRLPSDGFDTLDLASGERIRFFAPVPIDRPEFDAASEKGVAVLSAALVRAGVTEMLHFDRPSVARTDKQLRPGLISQLRRLFRRSPPTS
jgi:hypothetical protein